VHADDVLGVGPADQRADERTLVAALHAVALVAEPAHQLGEGRGDAAVVPSRLTRGPGEAVTGDRRDHQMEGRGGVVAVGPRVAERPDDVQELHDRAGPTVDQHQRRGVGLGRADVQEVDPLAGDAGRELGELVQHRLVLAPIERGAPVLGQLFQVPERHAPAPARAGQLLGPARPGQPVAQVVQVGLGDVDPERTDLGVGSVGVGHVGRLPSSAAAGTRGHLRGGMISRCVSILLLKILARQTDVRAP
jgi:hypothetical protein